MQLSNKLPVIAFALLLLNACTTASTSQKNDLNYAKFSTQQTPLATELTSEQEEKFALDLIELEITRQHYERAEEMLQKIRKTTSDQLRTYRLLAKAYEGQDKRQLALLAWREVNQLPGKTVDDEAGYAQVALVQGNYQTADSIYHTWLSSGVAEREVSALNNLGFSALLQKHYDEARSYFKQALHRDPLNSKALNNLILLDGLTGRK
ncbi:MULTISPECIES: tetratricopeptide repeat protein [Thiomicrorhabdus]|uniref:Tetratricopeptide repeat protein n=1 Tax=Thiomicrorhabdus heinhorstiae TaxID=2748010 RepID=A0ABS0BXY3_9GAMM|nr:MULTISPECIES: tetratricopeptide repeat protein [Thiomicrorhabdus]MBF6058653.1 tetratricopeptide repeat protein [Thiomicrorhabdus heinhorstiae]